MVASTFEIVAPKLFNLEKGYVNRPTKEDPGGPTNMGITLETFRAWRSDHSLTISDLKKLSRAEATEIYKSQYWTPIRADELPLGVDWAVFDFAVNSGPGRAVRELQKILGVKADGIVGLITLDAIRNYPGSCELIEDLSAARLKFMKGLSNWPYNKTGWTRRVKKVMKEAQSLCTTKDYRPDMGSVSSTPKAKAENLSVSKALVSKEAATLLTVAVPSISGLLMDFQLAKYIVAVFIGAFGLLALFWFYKQVKRDAI